MRQCYLQPDPDADRFNTTQLRILEDWDHPGRNYTRHWER